MTDPSFLSRLGQRLRAGETLVAAWSGIAEPLLAEIMARQGYDAVVIDMQHGLHTFTSAASALTLAALAGTPSVVRVPVGDMALASRLCDAGAAGVIAPMINSAADARALAAAVKYPPVGQRSWGPHRAVALSGLEPATYFAVANDHHLAIPMIETRAALDALDDILAVPGIDGVYVGPSDLSVALTGGPPDPRAPAVLDALDHIVARCRAAGKFAGLFCFDGAQAKAMGARGLRFCTVSTDGLLLATAAKAALLAAR